MGESRKFLEESLQSVIIDQHLWPRHTKKVCRTTRLASCCPVLVSDIISPAKQAGRCNNSNRIFISVTYFHITWSIINYWNKTAVLSDAAGLNRVGISLIFVTKSREKYSNQILFSFSQQQLKCHCYRWSWPISDTHKQCAAMRPKKRTQVEWEIIFSWFYNDGISPQSCPRAY